MLLASSSGGWLLLKCCCYIYCNFLMQVLYCKFFTSSTGTYWQPPDRGEFLDPIPDRGEKERIFFPFPFISFPLSFIRFFQSLLLYQFHFPRFLPIFLGFHQIPFYHFYISFLFFLPWGISKFLFY